MNGLFSSNANVVTSPAQLMANASRDLFTGLFNVGGLATPEQQVLGIMKDVDPTDLNSVKQAFRDIMNISPEAAVEFRKQMMPFIQSQQQQLGKKSIDLTAMQKNIRDIAINRYGCNISDPECYEKSRAYLIETTRQSPAEKGSGRANIEDVKMYAENSQSILQAGQEAAVRLAQVDQSLDLLESGKLYTGPGAGAVNMAHRIGAIFGIDSSEVSAASADQFISNSLGTVMDWVQKTKGAISEAEMRLFIAASPDLAKTKAGNKLLLNTLKRIYEYGQDLAQERSRFANEDKRNFYEANPYGNYVPNPYRWQIHLQKWQKDNPLVLPTQDTINKALGISSGDTTGKIVKTDRFNIEEVTQ